MTKPKDPKSGLSRNHQLFCEEYLLDFNGTRAYQTVYKKKNAASSGVDATKLLRKASVQEYLRVRIEERNAQLQVDQTYVINKCKQVLEADYTDAVKYMSKEDFEAMPEDQRKLVQSVKIKKSRQSYNHGKEEVETETYQVTFMSKDAANDLLAKHTGMSLKGADKALASGLKGFAQIVKELDV